MECYHYVNIFETKGLEYILVIVFLISLVLFMRHLSPTHRPRHPSAGLPLSPTDKLIVPREPGATNGQERDPSPQPPSPPPHGG